VEGAKAVPAAAKNSNLDLPLPAVGKRRDLYLIGWPGTSTYPFAVDPDNDKTTLLRRESQKHPLSRLSPNLQRKTVGDGSAKKGESLLRPASGAKLTPKRSEGHLPSPDLHTEFAQKKSGLQVIGIAQIGPEKTDLIPANPQELCRERDFPEARIDPKAFWLSRKLLAVKKSVTSAPSFPGKKEWARWPLADHKAEEKLKRDT